MTVSADLWDRCLENLKKDLNRQSFETWFKPTKASVSDNHTLKLQVPNEFFRDWIRDHYQPQIQKALKALHPEQLEIQFEVESLNPGSTLPIVLDGANPAAQGTVEILEKPRLTMPTPARPAGDTEFILNGKFNFESFVVGNSNRFAHAA